MDCRNTTQSDCYTGHSSNNNCGWMRRRPRLEWYARGERFVEDFVQQLIGGAVGVQHAWSSRHEQRSWIHQKHYRIERMCVTRSRVVRNQGKFAQSHERAPNRTSAGQSYFWREDSDGAPGSPADDFLTCVLLESCTHCISGCLIGRADTWGVSGRRLQLRAWGEQLRSQSA